MFNTNDKIDKILGNGQGRGNGLPRQGMGFGNGMGPGQGATLQNTNFNINPKNVIMEIQRLLDKLPEVKKASGNINIEFTDGKKGNFNIKYN
jgi:hypothetical protein